MLLADPGLKTWPSNAKASRRTWSAVVWAGLSEEREHWPITIIYYYLLCTYYFLWHTPVQQNWRDFKKWLHAISKATDYDVEIEKPLALHCRTLSSPRASPFTGLGVCQGQLTTAY
jgi:hypothetical protein